MSSKRPHRPALRYFGGKYRIAPWIVSMMPAHRIYVEPYGGAGSVLFAKPRSHGEVFNDLDEQVYSFFQVLRDPASSNALRHGLELTPYHRREFELAHHPHPDPVENARRLVIRSFMGFGADSVCNPSHKTGFRNNSNRSHTTPAKDWMQYPGVITLFTERLRGVTIECRDAFQVMTDQDSPDTLHYLDPPYPHSVRRGGRYKHEMTDLDHERLIDFVKTLKGTVMISGYDHDIYNGLGWIRHEKKARADKAKATTEVLWISK